MNRSIEFWSSVELGGFARGLVRELGALGWTATQRFEVTEASYRDAHALPARARLRWRSYVSYVAGLRRRLRVHAGGAPSVVVVCTNTFYAPVVAIRAARALGVPVVHWVFDLFPDVLVEAGKLRGGGLGERLLAGVARATFDGAAATVFLGQHLLDHARRRYGEIPRSVVIPVGADATSFRSAPPRPRVPGAPLGVLYCGNLGRMHDTATIAALLRAGPPSGWALDFRGHGSGFRELAGVVGAIDTGGSVRLGGSLDDSEWTRVMAEADVALVTMKRGAEGLVMPSKTYSAMAAGQAILAVCPRASDLAETVLGHQAGWVVEPGDVVGLRAVLDAAVARPDDVLAKRRNAFRAGQETYDVRTLAARWVDLLASLSASRR